MAKDSVTRTHDEIEDVIEKCLGYTETGRSKFPGMSYEDGVRYAIEWLLGRSDEHPMQDQSPYNNSLEALEKACRMLAALGLENDTVGESILP